MDDTPAELSAELRDAAARWLADDVDDATRAELDALLTAASAGDAAAAAEVTDRMAGPLTFGTAGLRGPVRAGINGMNTAVVVRTTAGVAEWLGARHPGGVVVVGRDARHGSAAFADATASVLHAAGFDVRLLPGPLPTPLVAYAVRALGAAAGIQITASHNPPADNGYKVYDDTGTQIVPPADTEIETAIRHAPAARTVPRREVTPVSGDDLVGSYLDRVAALPAADPSAAPGGPGRALRVAATPLHGVGGDLLRTALARAGFGDVHLVAEQADPNPDFPTVAFPNPEEPGATDRVLELAARIGADLVVALDPDADRCALGARDRAGSWRMLTGDETGVLLADHVLSVREADDPLVATTIVSSGMLDSVAREHGARHARTLTGFKWLARAGEGLVYAYEEALGVCVDPDAVRDKDGIAAAVVACDLAAGAKARGRTVFDLLDDLALRHGVYLTDQLSPRFAETAERAAVLDRLRTDPPADLAGVAVAVDDLAPETDAVRLRGDGLRVVLRPSGTEPKLKAYLEVTTPAPDEAGGLAAARRAAATRLDALRHAVGALLRDRTGA